MADTSDHDSTDNSDTSLTLHMGSEELVIRKRYEIISILNDVLIGIWFLVGSFFFLSDAVSHVGVWLFVIGSAEMLIRPVIRFVRRVHLQRNYPGKQRTGDDGYDF